MSALVSVLQRDRLIVLAALAVVTALAWWYLIDMARDMAAMDMSAPGESPAGEMASMEGSGSKSGDSAMAEGSGTKAAPGDESVTMSDAGGMMEMTAIPDWTTDYFVMMFLMWSVMMVGMMIPSAAPMVLAYSTFARGSGSATAYVATGAFTSGYLLAWTGFSLVATLLQWGLDELALLSPMMVSTSPLLGAGILIAAGIYQLTPFKHRCLVHCRHPAQYFMEHWRKGVAGALRMGLHHGAYCTGCCWFLMGLLFFGGVMNLVWIAGITVFVLLEKVLPFGSRLARLSGPALIAAGCLALVFGWTVAPGR